MTIQQFDLFTDIEKEEAIWDDGIFLINFDHGNHMCDVYQLFKFYVSLCYEITVNKPAEIVSAVYPDELPYLSKINDIFK